MKTIEEIELLSWKAIWLAVQNGKHRQVQRAIDEHVERFPTSEQDLVRLRTIHIVRDIQRQPHEVKSRIQRVSRTIRTLQNGNFNATRQEESHAS
ncbi:hypothetical protein KEHDKFFH_02335 [Marinobacter maroccanus]|uniref:Uncharacterized protein n=1 Tax=Marinobacter maroccanus TaxID=2055143 RepID=A0A2S5ZFW1_9GAMM|nr:hypothetical protein [Marinobacter maroccanus]PPI86178.1 hypothetical protein KEHDKFFH_02335 [Marinobacter maroccanus]